MSRQHRTQASLREALDQADSTDNLEAVATVERLALRVGLAGDADSNLVAAALLTRLPEIDLLAVVELRDACVVEVKRRGRAP